MDIIETLKNILPARISHIFVEKLPIEKVNEIRLRVNKRIVVSISGKLYYVGECGLTADVGLAIVSDKILISEIIKRASEHSFYAYANQLKNGFITISGGIRIGLCGEVVMEKGYLKTVKNISSINIRIPHEIKGCAQNILPYMISGGLQNTLIISPPGAGKTTMIRDVLHQLSEGGYCYSTLLVDERFEIANCCNGEPQLSVGDFTDIISGSSKNYGFEQGIRSMSPDLIVTDELYSDRDIQAVLEVANCGIIVLSSVHARSIEDLSAKQNFAILVEKKVFKRYVVLSTRNGPGTIEGIYDENLRCINY